MSNVTPKIFNDLYGDVISYDIPVKMYAKAAAADSEPMEFTIKASYDASPQFHLAATYESDSRWTLDKKITVYEGNGVNSELYKVMLGDKNPNSEQPTRRDSPTDALHIPWTASFSGSRNWSMGNRDGSRTKPTLRCNDQNGTQGRIWDDAGSEDSYSFEADVTDQTKSGHLTTRFINAPDYETPTDENKDNTYNVRIVGSYRIHKLGTPERTFGCETSAIDFTVTVKDVGPPAPLQELTLTQDPTDNAKFNIAWDSSNLNEFLEDGKRVDFPHTEFNVSSISFAHSPSGLTFPDSKTESPITITPGSGNEINGVVRNTGHHVHDHCLTDQFGNQFGKPTNNGIEKYHVDQTGKPAGKTNRHDHRSHFPERSLGNTRDPRVHDHRLRDTSQTGRVRNLDHMERGHYRNHRDRHNSPAGHHLLRTGAHQQLERRERMVRKRLGHYRFIHRRSCASVSKRRCYKAAIQHSHSGRP